MRKETSGIVYFTISAFLLSLLSIVVRISKNLGAYNLTFLRVFLSAITIYFFFLLFKKYKLAPLKYEKKKLVFFGAIHGVIILALFISYKLLDIASAILLINSLFIWVIIFSYFLLHENLKIRTIVALIISVVGILLVFPSNLSSKTNLLGVLAALFVGFGGGLVHVLSKTFKKYDKVSLTFWRNLIAIPFTIPLLFLEPITIASLNRLDILAILIVGPLSSLGFIFLLKGYQKVKGQIGGILSLLSIPVSISLALILFQEIPKISVIIGGMFIILGAYISLSKAQQHL